MKKATPEQEYTPEEILYLAFELGNTSWNLGFSTGLGQAARRRKVDARDLEALRYEIRLAKQRFHLPAEAPVKSCYEAGRDGFWLHRCLLANGINNQIVDSSSIEVNRRARRTKTDSMDVTKLLTMLIRYHIWRADGVEHSACAHRRPRGKRFIAPAIQCGLATGAAFAHVWSPCGFLHGEHFDHLLAARNQGVELFLFIRAQGTHLWTHSVGISGNDLGVQFVCLGQLADRAGEVPDTGRIDDGGPHPSLVQLGDQRHFQTTGSFNSDQGTWQLA